MSRCNECATKGYQVELPRDAWFECHRNHSDPLFLLARVLGWEASFMVDGNAPADSRCVAVLDAECETVCTATSRAAAEMIVKALEEFWAAHKLDGGQ